MKGAHRTIDELTRDGGDGLPPADEHETTWLFTCCDCGKRWADPPSIVSGCGCGSEEIVGHQFDADDYRELRFSGTISRWFDCPECNAQINRGSGTRPYDCPHCGLDGSQLTESEGNSDMFDELKKPIHNRTSLALVGATIGGYLGGWFASDSTVVGISFTIVVFVAAIWYLPDAETVANQWTATGDK